LPIISNILGQSVSPIAVPLQPTLHVLSYLKDAEATDMYGSRSGNPEHPGALIQLSLVKQALQTLDDQLHKLPIALGMILTTCRIYQDKELSIGLALARGTSNNEEPALRIWNLPPTSFYSVR
jgi:hypothetical protein